MSTGSTIVIKSPQTTNSGRSRKIKYSTNFLAICLWGLAAIVVPINTEISPNTTGISVSVRTVDVLIMLISTFILAKGLTERKFLCVIPWVLLSTWNLYQIQYRNIIKMGKILLQQKNSGNILPWAAYGMDVLATLLQVFLVARVIHLAVNQWHNTKLEKELKRNI